MATVGAQQQQQNGEAQGQQSTVPEFEDLIQRPVSTANDPLSILLDPKRSALFSNLAKRYAESDLVPQQFRGNYANCLIALQLALRMQVDPFMLMQNMYVVHGKPGLESKFAIAMCNQMRVFKGPIRFEMFGDKKTRGCTAWAIDRETGERVEETVTMEIAVAEGWTKKSGTKWLTMPDMMLKYRSAMWLIRTTCPEVLMGMQAKDEIEDVTTEVVRELSGTAAVFAPDGRSKADRLADQLKGRSSAPVEDEMETTDKLEVVSEAAPKGELFAGEEADSPTTDQRNKFHELANDLDTCDEVDQVKAILDDAIPTYHGKGLITGEQAKELRGMANRVIGEIESGK